MRRRRLGDTKQSGEPQSASQAKAWKGGKKILLFKLYKRYPYFVTNVLVPDKNGLVNPPEAPGSGVELRVELFKNGEAWIETIAEI